MRCEYCANYMIGIDRCKYCNFEYDERITSDDWDIFNLNEDDGWDYMQILYRLHSQGIKCVSVDTYFDENVAFIIGCFASSSKIANALNLDIKSIYGNNDYGVVILNLYKEKAYRLGIDVDKEWELMPCIQG